MRILVTGMSPVVHITSGDVQGDMRVVEFPDGRTAEVSAFLGVPYAAPPVGPLRYRPAVAASSWDGVRPCTAFGAAAMQPIFDDPSRIRYGVFEEKSEDCLFVNIWTPDPNPDAGALRPVIVFSHGGGYIGGSAAVPVYHGDVHAASGVVFVSVNHRLGGLGFICLDELFDGLTGTGNLGISDHVRVLHWLGENIAAFGGDPDNITLMGSSAGGLTVTALTASTTANHLFRRGAVLSSRAGHATLSMEQATAVARVFLDAVGVRPGDTEALRALPAERLRLFPDIVFGPMAAAAGQYPVGMVADGELLADTAIEEIRRGVGSHVDLIVGTTTEESRGELLTEDGTVRPGLTASLERALAGTSIDPDHARGVYVRSLAGQGLPVDDVEVHIAAASDNVMVQPTVALAQARAVFGGSGATHAYRFAWRSPGAGGRTGAHHGLPNPFFTGNMHLPGWRSWLGDRPPQRTADIVGAALRSFARNGDPDATGHPAAPSWPQYTLPQRATLWLDETVSIAFDPQRERRVLFAQLYS